MPDTAGNSLATATALNLTSAVQSFPDLVTPTANDYYRFALTVRSSLNVSITGLDADANLRLLDSTGNLVNINGVPQQSTNPGTFSELINTVLEPGAYFVQIAPAPAISLANYTLNISASENLVSTDILWRNDALNSTGIWRLDETSFVEAVVLTDDGLPVIAPPGWTVNATGDFNKDGFSDIVWRNDSAGVQGVWFMRGAERLSIGVIEPFVPPGWVISGTGDFNDDGYTDLIWRNESLATTGVWFMNGTTSLSLALIDQTLGTGWALSGTGDFNNDGKVDLLWRNQGLAQTTVWLLNGTQLISQVPILPAVPSTWYIGGTGDFNNDGKVDILWRDTNPEGIVGIWLMDGTTFSSAIALPFVPDLNWRPFAPYNTFGNPLPIDTAGNTRATAFNLGNSLTGLATYQEEVNGITDTDDYYRFNLANASQVSLSLTGFNANLELQLLNDAGAVLQSSTLGNLSPEAISRSLSAGTYFIRVFPNGVSDRSTYSLGVSVNNLPILVTNSPLTVNEEGSVSIGSSVLSVIDPDNTAAQITYSLNSLPANGTLLVNGAAAIAGTTFTQADLNDGTRIRYVHNGSETTSDRFIFTISDGLIPTPLGPNTFRITVIPINDAPELTLPAGTQAIDQETNTLIPGIRVTDVDLGTGEITVTLSAGNGVLSLGRITGITFLEGDGTQDQRLSFRGGQDITNFVLQSLIYRSSNNFRGTDTISVTVSDGGNTGLGGALSDEGVITLNVAPVNDPPVLTVPASVTVREDTSSPIPGIIVADLDAGTSLMRVSLSVTNGTVSLNSTAGITITTGTGTRDKNLVFAGSLDAINTVLAGLTYLGDRDFNGTDTLIISVSDTPSNTNGIPFSDTEIIAITVTAQNDPPVITVPGTQTVNENTDLRITGISITDVDATGDLTVNLSASSGRLSLASLVGLTFDQGDGTQDDALVFRGTQAAINDALRTLIYRANPDFNGNDTISINVSDGGSSGFGGVLGDSKAIAINILGINNAPVIIPPTASLAVDSDTNLIITGLRITDPDAGGGQLAVTLLAENGVLSLGSTAGITFLQGDGNADNRVSFTGSLFAINAALANLTYRSYPGFTNAFDRITISVNDGGNTGIGVPLSDTEVLFVSVGGAVNRPPIAVNDIFSVAEEGTLIATSVLANDNDPDFTLPLTAQLIAGPANALSFTLNPNGSFTYTPIANFSGSDTFTYRAVDALGGSSNTATVVINVSNVNDPPIAVDDSFITQEDQPITNGAVLTNDTDVDNTLPLSAQLISGPANAIAFTFNPNGTFSYTPRENFSGSDRFTYVVVDALGAISNTATVSITVTPVNDAPLARNDGPFIVRAGGTLSITAPGILSNDTDVDTPLANLTASLVTNPTNGILTLNPNGSFIYRPTGAFSGVDTFVYQVSDGALTSNLATVTISVGANNAPIANPESFTLPEDGSITLGNVLTNDTDPDGNLPLTATLGIAPVNALSFTLNPNGTFTYQPRANFNGVDSFVYQAIDSLGGISNPATVTFNITAVNDAPIAVNDTLSLSPGTTLSVTAPGILANDTDIDSPSLTAILVSTTAFGNLTLNPNGSFTYQPNPGFVGTDSFTYRANDGSLNSANTATVSLVVTTAANIAPIANTDTFTTQEDTPLTVGNVLANDTDPDNNLPLTASIVAAPTNALSFTLRPDGSFSYLPALNFNGIDTFTYIATDSIGGNSSIATVTFNVTPVNDAPVAVNDNYTVASTTSLNIAAPGVLANDTDVDSPSLTATLVSTTSNGALSLSPNGSFIYQPNAGFSGVDSFTYLAGDGSLNSANTATVNITVSTVVNSAPVANPDIFSGIEDTPLTVGNVLANDTDPDNNIPLTASIVAAPANALSFTLRPDGSFSYLPALNFNGIDTFTYVAVDALGARSQTATVTFSVTPVNDAPIANNNTFNVAPAGTLNVTLPGVLANDTDVDGDPLTATLVTTPIGAASFTLNPNGSFTYVPQVGFLGNDSFTYRASDGITVSNTATVTLSVTSNLPPTANPDTFSVQANGTLTVGNVLTNDTDADNNVPLTASVVAAPANALSFTLRPDGSFSYRPALNFTGTDTFTYIAVDSLGGSSTPATVTFSVTPANRAPIAANDTVTVRSDGASTITTPGILVNDTDPDGNPLTASLITNAVQGNVSLAPDGSFVYTPNAGASGNDSFTYVASDGVANSVPATVTLRINAAPIAANDTYTALVGSTLSVGQLQGVLTNDTDANGDSLLASVVSGPTKGVLTLNPNGAFTYTPNLGASGIDTFTYQALDGFASSTATVTLSLRTNTAPIAQPDAYRVPANGTLSVGVIDGVLRNDSDPDPGTVLSATLVNNASRGTVTLNPNGTFTYVPQVGFEGLDSFVYRASDGITVSGPATVTLTVSSNTPPVANNDFYSAFSGIPRSVAFPGVLANDTDVNGDSLSVSVVTNPANGVLTLNPNGSFVYTANSNFQGVDTFTYRAFDGIDSSTATVSISVTVNLPPVGQPDIYTIPTGQTLTVGAPGVLANDTDPEGSPLTALAVRLPQNGTLDQFNSNGSFVYKPAPGFVGVDSFTYRVRDNVLLQSTVTVTINVV
ncbi:pre-peptidase C family protein [Leptolyngbyaceae cyanobacterium JSC-12]|nr:pre-peptidase C family protein [Leptolyngbyaceae cyanobacterium JSC-12]